MHITKNSNTPKYKHQVWNNTFYKINQNMSELIRIEPWWTKQNEMINHISVKHVTDTQRMPKPNLMIMSCWNHNTYLFISQAFISQAFISSLIIVMVEFRYQNHSICFKTDTYLYGKFDAALKLCWPAAGPPLVEVNITTEFSIISLLRSASITDPKAVSTACTKAKTKLLYY